MDEVAEHLRFGVQLDQRPLNRLVGRERFAERLAGLGVLHTFVDAILRRSQRTRRLADAILVDEMLRHRQSVLRIAENCICRHVNIL